MEQIQDSSINADEKRDVVLRVQNVQKSYKIPNGKLGVLQDINFTVREGEFMAITGASGSGKTTLLMLLGAQDTPDAGEIWLDDVAVQALSGIAAADFRREKVGFVFQLFYLLPNLTALENVMAPLLPYRRKLNFVLRERAKELLERVGLGDRLGHPPARLSGGEQQRVAIARSLINRPRVLLADEPTGNLDPATGMEVLGMLRELQEIGKQTLILVTHDPQIAALAARHIRLEQLSGAAKKPDTHKGHHYM
jgi:ABC-type lipoprotein export system ATPase subunit